MTGRIMIIYKGCELYCDVAGDSDEFECKGIYTDENTNNDIYDTYCSCQIDKILDLCTTVIEDVEHDQYSTRAGINTDPLDNTSAILGRCIDKLGRI